MLTRVIQNDLIFWAYHRAIPRCCHHALSVRRSVWHIGESFCPMVWPKLNNTTLHFSS